VPRLLHCKISFVCAVCLVVAAALGIDCVQKLQYINFDNSIPQSLARYDSRTIRTTLACSQSTCNYVTNDEAPGSPCMLWKNTIPSCPWVSPTSSYPSSQNDGSQGPCNCRASVAFDQQPARDHMLPKGNGQRVQASRGKPAAAVRHTSWGFL